MEFEIVKVLARKNGKEFTTEGYKVKNTLIRFDHDLLHFSNKFILHEDGYYITKNSIDLGEIKEIDGTNQENFLLDIMSKLKAISIFDYLISVNFRKALDSSENTYIDLHLTEPIE